MAGKRVDEAPRAEPAQDLHSTEQEAQALTIADVPEMRMEWASVKNGRVTEIAQIEVPEEFFTKSTGSAIESVMRVRSRMLVSKKPRQRAQQIVDRLILEGVIARNDATHALAVIEVDLRKQVDQVCALVHQELSNWYPAQLKSLIPLIRRRVERHGNRWSR